MSESRTAEEQYQSAISSRNLGVELERKGDADAIMAGAWSDSATGSALLRLQAEWESNQKPRRPTPEQVTALVAAMNKAGSATYTAEQAMQTTLSWYANELSLFYTRLRSRRPAMLQLTAWANRTGHNRDLVPAVLYWWLAPTCVTCGGHGRMKAPGAPMLSAQTCKSCKGVGLKPVPHGREGRALATGFDDLANAAKASMSRKMRRS